MPFSQTRMGVYRVGRKDNVLETQIGFLILGPVRDQVYKLAEVLTQDIGAENEKKTGLRLVLSNS